MMTYLNSYSTIWPHQGNNQLRSRPFLWNVAGRQRAAGTFHKYKKLTQTLKKEAVACKKGQEVTETSHVVGN